MSNTPTMTSLGFTTHALPPNEKLTDDEERAKVARAGTCGWWSRSWSFGRAIGSVFLASFD
jgi:hypothetical protein